MKWQSTGTGSIRLHGQLYMYMKRYIMFQALSHVFHSLQRRRVIIYW